MGVRTLGQMGSAGKMDEKLKSESMQKEQFSEWGVAVKAGVENGAMLTTYLFRYTSECTTPVRSRIFKIIFAPRRQGAMTP